MKRSVILMGGKTYVLSLPSQWIKKYSIQKGEELDLEEKDNSIIVRTEKNPEIKEVELNFSSLDIMLGRAVGALYKAGYSRAKIHYETKQQLQKIEETLQRTLIGFAITKQEKNYIIIESLAEIKAEEFDASLKRMFYSLESMHEELLSALASFDHKALQAVIEKDGQINRLADFCRRVVNSGQTQFLVKPGVLYYVVEQLERIGDLYKETAGLALEKKVQMNASLLKLFKEIQALFVEYRILFYNFQFENFEAFGVHFTSLQQRLLIYLERGSLEEKFFVVQQKHLLEQIIDLNGALLTLHV